MKLNFLYPILVGLRFFPILFTFGDIQQANVQIPGYIRTEIETRDFIGYTTLNLGNPPQRITALMNSQETALLVLDSECLQNALAQKATCKRYCNDGKLCLSNCHPVCCESPQNLKLLCYNQTKLAYNRTASRTYRGMPKNSTSLWTSEYAGYRQIYGEYIQDSIAFSGLNPKNKVNKDSLIMMENTTFVSGWLVDPRLFRLNCAIFGFSPRSKNNVEPFILQAYHKKFIQKPLLSLAYRIYPMNGAMVLGKEEEYYCQKQWTYHEISDGEENWILEANGFEFNGQWFDFKMKLHTQPSESKILLPQFLIQPMLDNGTLVLFENDYVVDCSAEWDLTFFIGSMNYTLDESQLVDTDPWEHLGMCVARIQPLSKKQYDDTVDFVLGMPWFNRYCHTFDFERMMIGLTRNIRSL